jgi:RNA polymerase sigma factor (TIGR02999 family)
VADRAKPAQDVTRLLHAWAAGDQAALDQLMPIVYEELRSQARRYLRREGSGHTLQTTALVHEAYLRLVDQRQARWDGGRTQFFGVAAQLMRRILVDHARAQRATKRGGSAVQVPLEEGAAAAPAHGGAEHHGVDVLALDEALTRLAALDARQARVVELRYFTGLQVPEVAEVIGVSRATVERDWTAARAWLRSELTSG